jgi:hypothetical protein
LAVDGDLAAGVSTTFRHRQQKHTPKRSLPNCGARHISKGNNTAGIQRFVSPELVSALVDTFDAACEEQEANTEDETDQLFRKMWNF